MAADKPDRSALLEKVMGLIAADLASRKPDELEDLLETIGDFRAAKVPRMLITGNQAAMVFLHPAASRDEVVAGLRDTAAWIEQNWERIADRRGPGDDIGPTTPPVPGNLLN